MVVLGGQDDAAAIREATQGGSDVIYEALFGPSLLAALKSTKPGACSVTIGSRGGASIEVTMFDLFGKTLLSCSNVSASREQKTEALSTMARPYARRRRSRRSRDGGGR